jgi:3-hydroxyacyl-[acyl-carrier-protein] dehydratase
MTLPLPAEVIPHRPPFLFLDEVTELDPGVSAKGYWVPGEDLTFFDGHFPGRPTLPGVLMAESIAQLGAYAVLHGESFAGKLPLFGGLDGARFRRQVLPGERLDLELEVTRMSARAGKAKGTASVGGQVACACELMFVAVDA